MAQNNAFKRQLLIIYHLRTRPMTFDKLMYKLNSNVSKRTFERDLNKIEEEYGISIKRVGNKYEIVQDNTNEMAKRLSEAIFFSEIVKYAQEFDRYVSHEYRVAKGAGYITDILVAIKNRKVLKVYHQKYWDASMTERLVEPLAVKEFKYRWYLIAKDLNDNIIKSFGLDRIISLEQQLEGYIYPEDFDVNDYFKYKYGMEYSSEPPVDIELSFTSLQGNYVKTQPLHHSQKELIDNSEEYRISLRLIPTGYEFMRDLLQFGDSVKVLKPKWLADKIVAMHQKAIDKYKTE